MNCFSAFCTSRSLSLLLAGALLCAACGVSDSESADDSNPLEYSLHYTLQPDPKASKVRVILRLEQPGRLLRELSFPLDSGSVILKATATWNFEKEGALATCRRWRRHWRGR